MRQKSVLWALLLMAPLAIALLLGRTTPAQDRVQAIPVWEYELSASKIPGVIDARAFNDPGAKGWELCASTGAGNNSVFVFKRLKR